MVQSPSWETNRFTASQEIPRISRNPKVHYRTHKRPPPVSILGQPNPVHIPTSHLLEVHPNIIHPSTPRSPQWSPSLWFPHQDPTHPPLHNHTRQMPSPSNSSRFYHPHNIGWGGSKMCSCVLSSFTHWTNYCCVRYKPSAKEQPICAHDYTRSGSKYWTIRANNLSILRDVNLPFLSWHNDVVATNSRSVEQQNSSLRFHLVRLTWSFAKRMSRQQSFGS